MKIKAVVIVPCTHGPTGDVELLLSGPSLGTSHWSVHYRMEDGSLKWETDARNERTAHQYAKHFATTHEVDVEPYAWAPTPLLTACEFAIRTTFGYDLYDAGIQSEDDLKKQGFTTPEMAHAFALEFGNKHGLERIDV